MGFSCRVCGHDAKNATYSVREMMFGTKAEFLYDQCAGCKSIQIAEIPDEAAISSFYPQDYYAFAPRTNNRAKLKAWVEAARDRAVYGDGGIGTAINRFRVSESKIAEILRSAGVSRSDRILDVGCGAGLFLDRLARAGFSHLAGSDPFIPADTVTAEKVPIRKTTLDQISDTFDVLIFNHSFEHVPQPRETLRLASSKLGSHGICILRIPTPSSSAFDRYGVNWAHWDAPRHMTLISRGGMNSLAEACGFRVSIIVDEAITWSLMGSELYTNDISLKDIDFDRHFPRKKRREFRYQAECSNAAGRGDMAAFVLVKN